MSPYPLFGATSLLCLQPPRKRGPHARPQKLHTPGTQDGHLSCVPHGGRADEPLARPDHGAEPHHQRCARGPTQNTSSLAVRRPPRCASPNRPRRHRPTPPLQSAWASSAPSSRWPPPSTSPRWCVAPPKLKRRLRFLPPPPSRCTLTAHATCHPHRHRAAGDAGGGGHGRDAAPAWPHLVSTCGCPSNRAVPVMQQDTRAPQRAANPAAPPRPARLLQRWCPRLPADPV